MVSERERDFAYKGKECESSMFVHECVSCLWWLLLCRYLGFRDVLMCPRFRIFSAIIRYYGHASAKLFVLSVLV